jgi:general secretion pathway protein N
MRRTVTLSIAGLLVFIVLLLARFPASWAEGWLPGEVRCERLTGTIWNGRCSGLTVTGVPLGEARWSIAGLRPLSAAVAAQVLIVRPGLDVRGQIEAGASGVLVGRNVKAFVRLDRSVLPDLSPNVRGTVRATLANVVLSGKTVHVLEGRIEAHDLAQRALALGDYAVTFPPGRADAEPVGALEDLDGPLDVTGTLRLTREPGWVVEGRVAPMPDAPPELARQLQYLGPADASGRRPFSLAGTY